MTNEYFHYFDVVCYRYSFVSIISSMYSMRIFIQNHVHFVFIMSKISAFLK